MEDNNYCPNCGKPIVQPHENDEGMVRKIKKESLQAATDYLKMYTYLSAFVCLIILLFVDRGSRGLYFMIVCLVGLLYPLKFIIYADPSKWEKKLIVISGVSGLLAMLISFFCQRGCSMHNFISDLFHINTLPVYLWIYLFLLVATATFLPKKRIIGLCLSSFLLGILLPIIIAGLIVLIVALTVLVFGSKTSKGRYRSLGNEGDFSDVESDSSLEEGEFND